LPARLERRQLHRLPVLALERRGALLDARRLDESAGRAAVGSPIGNSSTPYATDADVMFMLKRRSQVASEHTNSPVSSMLRSESLRPAELKIT
jgi:hypothetical protein